MNAPPSVAEDVRRALAEDVGAGDLTAAVIPAERTAEAEVIAREAAVVCGRPWFDGVFAQLDPAVTVTWACAEGEPVAAGAPLCRLAGPARSLVSGERTALNFLQTLSATATTTRALVDAVAGTGVAILDTRKTLPGLRAAQKYAVRAGGGGNQRQGLFDALLVKENHILAAGSITAAVTAARAAHPTAPLQVEVETLDELREALAAGVERVMLDNFDCAGLRAARAQAGPRVRLEASGNVDADGVAAIAASGVDDISVGALTKHIRAVDLSMRFRGLAGREPGRA